MALGGVWLVQKRDGDANGDANGVVSRLIAERANRRLPTAGLRHGDTADRRSGACVTTRPVVLSGTCGQSRGPSGDASVP